MTTTTLSLKYVDNVGFNADNGGRGFHLPTSMVIRATGAYSSPVAAALVRP